MDLLKYYACEILYHPSKANVVTHALSRKESPIHVVSTRMRITSFLPDIIRRAQMEAVKLEYVKGEGMVSHISQLEENEQGMKTF